MIVSAVKNSGGQRFKTVLPRMVYNASTKSASITRRSPTIRAALLTPSLAPSVGISPRATTRYAPNIPTPSAATPSRVTRSRNTIQESAAVKSDSVEISSATSEAVESARPIYSNSLLSTHPSRISTPSVSRSRRLRRMVLMRVRSWKSTGESSSAASVKRMALSMTGEISPSAILPAA